MGNNASFPGGRRDIGFSGQELFYIDEESFGNIICFFILSEMSLSVLISILPSKILGVAAKDIIAKTAFAEMDKNRDGAVTIEEFVSTCIGQAEITQLLALKAIEIFVDDI